MNIVNDLVGNDPVMFPIALFLMMLCEPFWNVAGWKVLGDVVVNVSTMFLFAVFPAPLPETLITTLRSTTSPAMSSPTLFTSCPNLFKKRKRRYSYSYLILILFELIISNFSSFFFLSFLRR